MKSKELKSSAWRLALSLGTFTALVAMTPPAIAQDLKGAAETPQNFNIPAQSLESALAAFAKQTQLQLIAPSNLVGGLKTGGVSGQRTPGAALEALLAPARLTYNMTDNRTVAVVRVVAAQPEPQAPAAMEASARTGLEEVVVTARRREERLQTVPITVNVASGSALSAANINDTTDLEKLIPALSVAESSRNAEGYEIRGISNAGVSGQGQSPAITAYFAEVPLPVGDGGGPGRYFDLENVQVLEGPQGTLFGRNSTGGAVLLQPQKPKNAFAGYLQAQFGNYSDEGVQGAIDIPIASDKLLVRVAGEHETRDGFTKDILNGKDLDNRDYWGGRLSIVARPTDDFENYLVADSYYSHNNGTSEVIGAFDPSLAVGTALGLPIYFVGAGPVPTAAATPAGRVAAKAAGGYAFFPISQAGSILAQQRALGPREIAAGNSPLEKIWSWGITDIATWNLSDAITFRNIFGYRQLQQLIRYDSDGTVLPVLAPVTPSGWSTNLGQYTEEAQFQGKSLSDSLNWVVGAFGLFSHPTSLNRTVQNAFGSSVSSESSPTSRSEAVYAQATYDLGHSFDALEGLKFTAGYRYSWDYRALGIVQKKSTGACSAPGADLNCAVSVEMHSNEPAWTLGLDYQITPDTMVYVTARHGFRAGGLNAQSLIASQISFKPEIVQDEEIGVKSDWQLWGVKARTNLSAYHASYDRRQGSQAYTATINGSVVTTNLVVNGGNVTIQGLEANLTVVPIADLELTGAWAYNQAKYDIYTLIATGETVPGETYPYLPQNSLALGARYKLPVDARVGDMSLSASLHYQSHQYLGVFPADPAYTTIGSGYTTIDLGFAWNNVLTYPMDLSVFATNVTNNVYKVGGFPLYSTSGFASFIYGEPTMYGVKLKYRFGGPSSEPEAEPAAYVPPPAVAPAPAPKSYLVFFDFNKSDLTPQAAEIVGAAAKNAGPAKVTQLTVTGHTDTAGSDAYNMRLSRRRAESVAAELEKDGIPSSEIEIVAKGKRDLLVPTADGVREPQNRRVQIVYAAAQS